MFSFQQDRMVSMVMDREYDVAVEAVKLLTVILKWVLESGEANISDFYLSNFGKAPSESNPSTCYRLTLPCVMTGRQVIPELQDRSII